jgi:aspartate racemase
MKTIGILGGMSWESTAIYYRLVNEEVRRCRGGLASAPMLITSFDFDRVARLQREGDWTELARWLCDEALKLEVAGADAVLVATNTMHKVAPEIERALAVPLLHIAEVTAHALKHAGITHAALLGTRFTMTPGFYTERLARHGIACELPEQADQATVHAIIFDELCQGHVREASRRAMQRIAATLAERGAQALVLGCTELTMLIDGSHVGLPVFDTTALHARAAARFVLAETSAAKEGRADPAVSRRETGHVDA